MHKSLVDFLVDPETKEPLGLASETDVRGDDVLEGALRSRRGREYPVTRGIPRFVEANDAGQEQTGESFGYKWRRQGTFDEPETIAWARTWLLERYGFADASDLRRHFAAAGRVLDAGCGSGYSAALWLEPGWSGGSDSVWFGVDYSEAVDVARERLGHVENTHFIQADVNHLPFAGGSFGAAFSEGVLHHTPSTEHAFESVAASVRAGGELLVYVYRRKGPIREFSDDFLRDELAPLPPDEALERMRPLTELARALARLDGHVIVHRDVPELGIEAGEYPVQRFVYWHFLKAFWNDAFTFEANNLVNFDWYHPRYAHRHTENDLRAWCSRLGLEVTRLDAQESGFTLRASKLGEAVRDAGALEETVA